MTKALSEIQNKIDTYDATAALLAKDIDKTNQHLAYLQTELTRVTELRDTLRWAQHQIRDNSK